jgi:nucleoside 2-deoxyribosyltransferase
MKIVICGSMTASKEMVDVEKKLKDLGHEIVLPEFTHEHAAMDTIDKMHTESARDKVKYDLIRGYFEKIRNNDAVFIANVEKKGIKGYVGGNSFLEMGFAFVLNKPIYLLHKIPDVGYRDEIEAMSPIILNGDFSKIAK